MHYMINTDDFMRCYKQKMTDDEISKELNVSFSDIGRFRSRHSGLKKWNEWNRRFLKVANPEFVDKFEELYMTGLTDVAIAKELKCDTSTIKRLRDNKCYVNNVMKTRSKCYM